MNLRSRTAPEAEGDPFMRHAGRHAGECSCREDRPAGRRSRLRVVHLLGSTVLAGLFAVTPLAHAQVTVGGKPPKADNGDSGITLGGTNADNGTPGPTIPPHTNNATVTSGATAYFGDARGGDGGDGGTAFDPCATFIPFPPLCIPGVEGGDGGDGGQGGTVNLTNTGDLSTSGAGAHGIRADAGGGDGGKGGWAADFGLTDSGDGGDGGNGGNARAVATDASDIRTSGDRAYGIYVNASGGQGGNGGFEVTPIVGSGGSGGRGGMGGTAYGENQGYIETQGSFASGILVRSVGGVAGDGAGGFGLISGSGGNGGLPTIGGSATGLNSGTIITNGNFAHGMVVQSVGGGGGDGGGAFGLFGGGGAGAPGNHGGAATGTNTGLIETSGIGAIGMLVESVGGGGGDGGGAVGSVALGGTAAGGGDGRAASGFVGGTIRTGINGGGDGAHGVLIQSVGGGGGNGGFAIGVGPVVAVGVGGGGGTGGDGGDVEVRQAGSGPTVETNGTSAIGIFAQSVGGGGGNGGGAYTVSGAVSVSIGGEGNAAGHGGIVTYDVGSADVTTRGSESAGILAQSVGGGGGNGGFALALAGATSVGVGGSGGAGGEGRAVSLTSGGVVNTHGHRSSGIVAQSVGGGGGNGGGTLTGSIGINVAIGGTGAGGAGAGTVDLTNSAAVTTRGVQSHALLAQSVGGGGGSGGFAFAIGGPSLGIGGGGAQGGISEKVTVRNTGALETREDLSIGLFAQSVGGGGGDGGFAITGGLFAAVSIGGTGGGGGIGGVVDVENRASILTSGVLAHGILAQSVGGGGGNGGASAAIAAGAFGAAGVAVGGGGGNGGTGGTVDVTHAGDITVGGAGAKGILAQSVGGGGGNGGSALSGAFSAGLYGSGAAAVSIGGSGGAGGDGGVVTLKADGNIVALSNALFSGGIVAQSIGGGGGNGGRATSIAGGLSTAVSVNIGVSVGGSGGGGGVGEAVTVETGLNGPGSIVTRGDQSIGLLAQSIGGGGGNGGDSWSASGGYAPSLTVNATVTVGGNSGDGNISGAVDVTNAMTITTYGDQSGALVAQSIGGGGGNGGSSSGATGSLDGGGVNIAANVAVGATGGTGGHGNIVEVVNSGALTTSGDFSAGITAQSIGGGGGSGGSSNAKAFNVGSGGGTNIDVNVGIGGSGGSGGDGRAVTVVNSGVIQTSGFQSIGIMAMSVGGGGGAGGAASTGNESKGGGTSTVSIGASIALAGGTAGIGGAVTVTNSSFIVTNGADSHGISANSIGGGGGIGGAATAGATAEYAIGGAIGGFGGGAGDGGAVTVNNLAGAIILTWQERSIGIFAQSVGGGGGAGGAGKSTGSDGGTVDVKLSIGGSGAGGGNGGVVRVENAGLIATQENHSHGIMAQSVGGSGGIGGASGTATADAQVAIGLTLGGTGGDGGFGEAVTVVNSGQISTGGDNAYGIFAQSVGGGGGAAGAGSTEGGESEVNVNVALGGVGGDGNHGGTVQVDNLGRIETQGALSHGIFAQSVGGGGGASGAASNASEADLSIGITSALVAGDGAAGGDVIVNNAGYIETRGAGALGIMAQSVGGGGGYGGVVSDEASGDQGFALSVGGFGGAGGDGGDVTVDVSGAIVTYGERAHGVVAQSVGGGGGYGGDANGKTGAQLAIGGGGGAGGHGGDVTVNRTGTITTYGADSIAIIAQSVGGGGGIGGAGFGRFSTGDDGDGPDSFAFNTPSGGIGNGGVVTIIQDGEIETDGARAHGIVAQAVGGGGGAGGTSSLALGQSGAGSAGGEGDAAAASATARSQVLVRGASSYALFGQSATGDGNANAVSLTAQASLFAQGADSVAAYGESTGSGTKGDIVINLDGPYTVGGSGTGVAAMFVGGAANSLNNRSLLLATGAQLFTDMILEDLIPQLSPLAITGTGGNDQIENTVGRIIGNIGLGSGVNGFHNHAAASMVGIESIDLGGGLMLNSGLMTMNGIGVLGSVDLTGAYTQDGGGQFVLDVDLDTQTTDFLGLLGAGGDGDFAGTAPLNFLSIDKLFERYTISRSEQGTMNNSGLTPTTAHPTVGFTFLTEVENGTDLVLYADKPSFLSLAQDPNSGTTDPGVFEMAVYLDGIEAASSPDNPMARLINMLRFLPDEEELGKALTRLTPHYAVHTFEMMNRSTDILLETARACPNLPGAIEDDGRCLWFAAVPRSNYERDTGPTTTRRDDVLRSFSIGGLGEVTDRWSLGLTLGITSFESEISFKDDLLSLTTGDAWQAHALARYVQGPYFADFSLGGGTGSFRGERDTTLAQVSYIPGETIEGVYLPELLHEGIGNSVTYRQRASQFGASTRLGYRHQAGSFYLQPQVQFDLRWLRVSGTETGSVAAFKFDGSSNLYYSATPGLEVGFDVDVGGGNLRLFATGGIELSNRSWKIEGQFEAAENLGAPPLSLTQRVDSPLYRVGAGMEFTGSNGIGASIRYHGAFGEAVEHQSVSAGLKIRF